MNSRFTTVETSLNRAEFRLKWLRLWERSFALGCVVCLVLLAFGGAVLLGWVRSKPVGIALVVVLAGLSVGIWRGRGSQGLGATPARPPLAAALEREERRLLDRLNTLLFLETGRGELRTEAFGVRIARQLHRLLSQQASPAAFPARLALLWMLGFMVALTATVLLYQLGSPWS